MSLEPHGILNATDTTASPNPFWPSSQELNYALALLSEDSPNVTIFCTL